MKTNARRKFIATLLALSLILTGFPGTAVWAQSGGTDQTEKQAAAVSSEQPVSQAQPSQEPEVFQLDADCKLLNYVHAEVFAQNNHVARLRKGILSARRL